MGQSLSTISSTITWLILSLESVLNYKDIVGSFLAKAGLERHARSLPRTCFSSAFFHKRLGTHSQGWSVRKTTQKVHVPAYVFIRLMSLRSSACLKTVSLHRHVCFSFFVKMSIDFFLLLLLGLKYRIWMIIPTVTFLSFPF